ncbi:glycoprotein endo-alpha-1,2-mannosidase [Eurytemora carolleeae]|uniref:glycoprotein endo-alpha-1,2-mannosidase n=1 Tax=Eurytemora carolleeae TaxID=1294199 RepID=UPI000C7903D3|nr:glycoprotein endo-alpha-1,2-mannosidase [Eurytemora carolleeae]|eukprot:XP_023332334.1 glycoprotein endo-alpha-1,2-mannosidase-like [Eurytemora affinis]
MFSRRGIKYAKRSLFFLLGILFFFLLSFLFTDSGRKRLEGGGGEGGGNGGGDGGVQEIKQLESDLAPPYEGPSHPTNTRLNTNVHIFYYGWYGTPAVDGEWVHWNHRYLENWDTSDKKVYPTGDHQPPEDIGANFYPSLGPYSSRNETVIEQHFKWISDANIGVISVSWYPPGLSDENGPKSDELIPTLLRIAQKYNLKVCLHVEPYKERSAENLRKNLQYVYDTYSIHPAYYTIRELNMALCISSSEWSRLFSRKGDLTVRETELDGIFIALLVEMKHRYDIKKSSFDGFYTYFASNGFTYGSTWKNWKGLADYAMKNSLIFLPSVGPGYLDTRVRPWNSRNTRLRRNGLYYEIAWRAALQTSARYISITSFNEWHEGTQIEPCIPYSSGNYTYSSYSPHKPDNYLQITRNFTFYPSINKS